MLICQRESVAWVRVPVSPHSGCSVARLSRLLWEQEVAGSNPATPTTKILSTNVGGIFYFFVFELAQKDKKIKNNSERSSKDFGEQLTQIQDHEIILIFCS